MKIETVHLGSRKIVATEKIKMLQADINYTIVYLIDGAQLLVSTTMGIIQKRLPNTQFVRVNRKEVVNVKLICKLSNNGSEIQLSDDSLLTVSRRRRMQVMELMQTTTI